MARKPSYQQLPTFLVAKSIGTPFTPDEEKHYIDMPWGDYYDEMEKAYKAEKVSKKDKLTPEEEKETDAELNKLFQREMDLRATGIKRQEEETLKNVKIFDAENIQLPSTIEQIDEAVRGDMLHYIPPELQKAVRDDKIVIEILTTFMPYYSFKKRKQEGPQSLGMIVAMGEAAGLGFRMCKIILGNYFAVYFNFTARQDEVLYQEFKSNRKEIEYDELMRMDIEENQRELEELRAHDHAKKNDPEEEEEIDERIKYLKEQVRFATEGKRTVDREKYKVDMKDIRGYIYSELMPVFFYKCVRDTVNPKILDKRRTTFDHTLHDNMKGDFSFMVFVPCSI